MERWHLLYTKRNQETPVNLLLQQRGWETYLPGVVIERGYGRGTRLDPLFPRYIFVQVDLYSKEAQGLPYLTGVSKIVAFDGTPAEVSETVLKAIRRRCTEYIYRLDHPADLEYGPEDSKRIFDVHTDDNGYTDDLDRLFQPGMDGSQRSQLLLFVVAK